MAPRGRAPSAGARRLPLARGRRPAGAGGPAAAGRISRPRAAPRRGRARFRGGPDRRLSKAADAAAALDENSAAAAKTSRSPAAFGVEARDIGTATSRSHQAFERARADGSEQQPDGFAAERGHGPFADWQARRVPAPAVDGGANRIDGISFGLNDPAEGRPRGQCRGDPRRARSGQGDRRGRWRHAGRDRADRRAAPSERSGDAAAGRRCAPCRLRRPGRSRSRPGSSPSAPTSRSPGTFANPDRRRPAAGGPTPFVVLTSSGAIWLMGRGDPGQRGAGDIQVRRGWRTNILTTQGLGKTSRVSWPSATSTSGPARQHPRADRPERRGQDDVLQPAHEVPAAHARRDPLQRPRHHRSRPADVARLGLVRSFQISAVFPHLTVLENVRIALQRSAAIVRFLALRERAARARRAGARS